MKRIAIIGGGLTAGTLTHFLTRQGMTVDVYEKEDVIGGLLRTEWMNGVPYEPFGPHIFHTNSEWIWQLVTSHVDMLEYAHEGWTQVPGLGLMSYPPQISELRETGLWREVSRELQERPAEPSRENFETWCLGLMGPTLYRIFIRDYTAKQWGRPPAELSSLWAPAKIELRDDDDRRLFRDRFQGWPRQGYTPIVKGLLATANVHTNCGALTAQIIADDDVIEPGVPIVVTAPLDQFFDDCFGVLEWRGITTKSHWVPGVTFAQEKFGIKHPGLDVPYTRTIEAKHAFGDELAVPGTVLSYEYPGSPVRQYPVHDVDGKSAALQKQYLDYAGEHERNPLIAAGRLAKYAYWNMDEAIRNAFELSQVIAAEYA